VQGRAALTSFPQSSWLLAITVKNQPSIQSLPSSLDCQTTLPDFKHSSQLWGGWASGQAAGKLPVPQVPPLEAVQTLRPAAPSAALRHCLKTKLIKIKPIVLVEYTADY